MRSDITYKTNIVERLQDFALSEPNQQVFLFLNNDEIEQQHLTYAELDAKAQQIAGYLQQYATAGDRILLAYLPGLDFICAFLGCLYAGLIAVPTYPMRNNHHADRMRAIIKDCDPKLILGADKSLEIMQQIPEFSAYHSVLTDILPTESKFQPFKITTDGIAFIQYTSGSTGTPKGVMVSHGNLMANLAAIDDIFQLKRSENVLISWLPMQHDMGLIGHLSYTLYSGITSVLMSPTAFLEKPMRWLNAISQSKSNAVCAGGPNFAYQLCVDAINAEQLPGIDLSHWTIAFCGSEPIHAETLKQFSEKFSTCGFRAEAFLPTYGMAEATLLISGGQRGQKIIFKPVNKAAIQAGHFEYDPSSSYEIVSSGPVHKTYTVKIVNPETVRETVKNEIGEIWVCGPSVAQGYWNKLDITEKTFHARLPNDNNHYLRTGDLGYLDGNELYVTGRLKDLIILQGHNIYPQDVEALVDNCHPAIRKGYTAAFSIEVDNQEQLVIVAEIKRTARKMDFKPIFTAIRRAIYEGVAAIPYSIQLLAPAKALRTTSGKIQRHSTKKAYEEGQLVILAQDELSKEIFLEQITLEMLEKDISSLLAKVLSVDTIDSKQSFSLLGGTSLEAVTFQKQLQTYVGSRLTLSSTIIFDYPNVHELAEYIYKQLSGHKPAEIEKINLVENHREPIAIIGMSCQFPGGANTPEAFWSNLQNKVDGIVEVPKSRWAIDEYYDANPNVPGKMITRYGGFIDNLDKFDAQFFGITPREAEFQDPQQRRALELTWEALERAGYPFNTLNNVFTSVYIGVSNSEYGYSLIKNIPLENIDAYLASGNSLSAVSGRISYSLGFRGPSLSMDTACSSSLVAIHEACQSLRHHECDLAVSGGVNAILLPELNITLSKAHMLSPEGHCKTFDESADGYVRSEGVGIVILKRLSDAQRDGDNILAVIKNSAVRQDGASGGLTVPNGMAQQEVMRQALGNIDPLEIDYIEAHGTGTSLGDPIEVSAIAAVYGSKQRKQPLVMGALKSSIGHTEAASGVAGLIKTVLMLQNKQIAANLHFNKLNPKINLEVIPAILPLETIPWEKETGKRMAGVSSFGFTGTIAHLILEEAPDAPTLNREGLAEEQILVLSALTQEALQQQIQNYIQYLTSTSENIADICYTTQIARKHFENRVVISGKNAAELVDKLKNNIFEPIENTNEIISQYLQGNNVDWQLFSSPYRNKIKHVLLPTYPFERIRYWAKELEFKHNVSYKKDWELFSLPINDPIESKQVILLISEKSDQEIFKGLNMTLNYLPYGSDYEKYFTEFDKQNAVTILYYPPNGKEQEQNLESLKNHQHIICEDWLRLMHIMANYKIKCHWWLITQNVQKLPDTKMTDIANSVLLGLRRVTAHEYSHWNCRHIDFTDGININALSSLLLGTSDLREDEFVFYQQQCVVPKLIPVPITESNPNIHPDASYLITGGLGALGLLFTESLIQKGAKHIILTSRHPPAEVIQNKLTAWNENGIEVQFQAMDVSNPSDVLRIVKNSNAKYPLKGIIHTAGIIDDGLLSEQTWERFEAVLSGKAWGAWNLHAATQSLKGNLDFFVCFSSTASAFGTPAQGNYAAANAFLDSLADYRQQNNLVATTIAWGPWSVGMAAEQSEKVKRIWQQLGIKLLSAEEGEVAFWEALNSSLPYELVIDMDVKRLATYDLPLLERLKIKPTESAVISADRELVQRLTEAGPSDRKKILRDIITLELHKTFKLPAAQIIEENRSLFEMGMDSLMALELKDRLEVLVKLPISNALLFEHPTINQLIDYISELLSQVKTTINKSLFYADAPEINLPPLEHRIAPAKPPLSINERAIWVGTQEQPDNIFLNMKTMAVLKIDLDTSILEKALSEIIEAHEILRTTYHQDTQNDLYRFVHSSELSIPIEHYDFSMLAENDKERELQSQVKKIERHRFNLELLSLFKLVAINLGNHEYAIIINMHHIIGDGYSISLLVNALIQTYLDISAQQEIQLQPEVISYTDYALWQEKIYQEKLYVPLISYWAEKMKKAENLLLPYDSIKSPFSKDDASFITLKLHKEKLEKLFNYSTEHKITPYVIVMGAWLLLMKQLTLQNNLLIETILSNRITSDRVNIMGNLATEGITFYQVNEEVSVIDFLNDILLQSLDMNKLLQDFGLLVFNSTLDKFPDMPTVAINYHNEYVNSSDLKFEIDTSYISRNKLSGNLDLFLEVWPKQDGMVFDFLYRVSLFEKDTIKKFAGSYFDILDFLVDNPATKLSEYK